MKKGFTLVELIVVIGIIAILTGVLFGSFAGSTASAKAARCLSNMKNLASACQSRAIRARSFHNYTLDESRGIANAEMKYSDMPGWISWDSRNGGGSKESDCAIIGMYSSADDGEVARYALTNGCIWAAIQNSEPYVCPLHKKQHSLAHWSYLMNKCIGDNDNDLEHKAEILYDGDNGASHISHAERILLFAEVPFALNSPGDWKPEADDQDDEDHDAVLDYERNETIGANHQIGRDWFAHIVFCDGHIEKLRVPGDVSGEKLVELTKWLCEGKEVGWDSAKSEFVELK